MKKKPDLNKDILSKRRDPRGKLFSFVQWYYFLLNVERTYRAISSRRRRIAIMATPLKMDFIKAIFSNDRCRRKRRKSEPKGMRPLPLADPLRMIITSRRLNFALLRPYPSLS